MHIFLLFTISNSIIYAELMSYLKIKTKNNIINIKDNSSKFYKI